MRQLAPLAVMFLPWVGLHGAAFDAAGNVYLVTSPTTFTAPTTPNAFQSTESALVCGYLSDSGVEYPISCTHGYIRKVSPDGRQLLAATYLGGSGQDFFYSIATDQAGNIYVAGQTNSSDFPLTPDAFDKTPGPAFFSVLNPDCTKLLYSTYIGLGTPYQILVDSSGRAILVGTTDGNGFPATAPVTSHNTARDAFVVRFNTAKSKLEFALEFGGRWTKSPRQRRWIRPAISM